MGCTTSYCRTGWKLGPTYHHSHQGPFCSSQSGRTPPHAGTIASISQRHTGHLAMSLKTRQAQQLQKCVWPQGTRQVLAVWWRQMTHSSPAVAGKGDNISKLEAHEPVGRQPTHDRATGQKTRQPYWRYHFLRKCSQHNQVKKIGMKIMMYTQLNHEILI